MSKIDTVAVGPEGPVHYQTDHRPREEIEAAPELSVLFALTRVRNARRHNAAAQPVVVYIVDDVPPFLEEAIAAAGGLLERPSDHVRRTPAPSKATAAELADRAFRGLAQRVQHRFGADDATAALRALEAEILASPSTLEADEVRYWMCVCELSALTGEILRAKYPGAWVEADHPVIPLGSPRVIPFGFSRGAAGITLLTHRAQLFIEDGEAESMFQSIAIDEDLRAHPDGTARCCRACARAPK